MYRTAATKDFMATYLRPQSLVVNRVNDASVVLWLIDIERAGAALLAIEEKTSRLSQAECLDFETATNYERARTRYVAHIALRLVLERWLGARAVRGVGFDADYSGKLYLNGSGLDFSLSYSGHMVLIGVRTAGAIGVDLECDRQVRMSLERRAGIIAAADALHDKRRSVQVAEDQTLFLQAWTRLEAVSKATGLGIGRVLGHFGLIGSDRAGRAGDLTAVADFAAANDLVVSDLEIGPGLYASIAQIRGTITPQIGKMPNDRDGLEDFVADIDHRR